MLIEKETQIKSYILKCAPEFCIDIITEDNTKYEFWLYGKEYGNKTYLHGTKFDSMTQAINHIKQYITDKKNIY